MTLYPHEQLLQAIKKNSDIVLVVVASFIIALAICYVSIWYAVRYSNVIALTTVQMPVQPSAISYAPIGVISLLVLILMIAYYLVKD